MKIAIVVLSFAIAIQAHVKEEQEALLREYKELCITITGVPVNLVDKAKAGEFVKNSLLNDFFCCLGKKIGFLNEAGEFQKDVMKAKITLAHTAKEAEAVVAACTKATPQLTCVELAKCLYEQSGGHFRIF